MNDVATQTVNGWANRETWLVNLWIGSEPASQAMLERFAALPGPESLRAEKLREEVEGLLSDSCGNESSLWTDLLYVSLSRVDWCEIIEGCAS